MRQIIFAFGTEDAHGDGMPGDGDDSKQEDK
jgi:hypothetical protein